MLCVAFVLPLAVWLSMGLPRLMFHDFTDGVFYLGYALNFEELISRVGLNYYSVRFGGILPDAAAFSIFGASAGLSIVRFGLSGLCSALLCGLFAARGSYKIGLLAAFFWAINPASIRLLQTAYVDVAGTYFLLLGITLLVFPRVKPWMAFLAGISLCLAGSAHLHAVIALFFCLPLICLMRMREGLKNLLQSGIIAMLGIAVVAIGAGIFYFWNFGLFDWTSPTREYFSLLQDGLSSNWKKSWAEVVKLGPFWFIPIPMAVALLFLRQRDSFIWGAFVGVAGYVGFLFYGDLLQGGFSLSMFYYFSFALPALTLFLAGFSESLITRKGSEGKKCSLATAILLLIAFLIPVILSRWMSGINGSLILLIALCGIAAWIVLRIVHDKRTVMGAAMIFFVGVLIVAAPTSSFAVGRYAKDDLWILEVAQRLRYELPKYKDDPGIMRFWFDDADGSDLRMLQSFYLHHFMRLQREDRSAIPFEPISKTDAEQIKTSGTRHLVILGNSPEELDRALSHLSDAGVDYQIWKRKHMSSRNHGVEIAHLYRPPEEYEVVEELNLQTLALQKDATQNRIESGLQIRSAPIKWNFDATLPVRVLNKNEGLRLRFKVVQGMVGVGLLGEHDGNLKLQASQSYSASSKHVTATIWPEEPESVQNLYFRNLQPKPSTSLITIHSVEVIRDISVPDHNDL